MIPEYRMLIKPQPAAVNGPIETLSPDHIGQGRKKVDPQNERSNLDDNEHLFFSFSVCVSRYEKRYFSDFFRDSQFMLSYNI